MAATTWTFAEMRKHFFVYMEQIGTADLLDPLRNTPPNNARVALLTATLHRNLKATAFAASTSFYAAQMGAATARTDSIKVLVDKATASTREATLHAALSLLADPAAFIGHSFETMKTMHDTQLLSVAFQTLLRQSTAMTWAAFETFTLDLLTSLFAADLKFLRAITAVQTNKDPWSNTPTRLLTWIEDELKAKRVPTAAEGIDSYPDILSINIRALRHLFGIVFAGDPHLLASIGSPLLSKLSAQRHLLMHRAGVVNQEYLDKSGERMAIGTDLVVTPADLVQSFQAVAHAGAALAKAADAVM